MNTRKTASFQQLKKIYEKMERLKYIIKDQEDVIQSFISDSTKQSEKENALLISEKRYEIVMSYSDLTMFTYDISTKKMIIHNLDAVEFNLPVLIDNDITDKKIKEMAIREGEKLFEKMISKSTVVFAVNLSKNKFISGHEKWHKKFKINDTDNYDEIIIRLCKKTVYSGDQVDVMNIFLRETILNEYKNGKDKVSYNYRVLNGSNEFVWAHSVMNLFEDKNTGDITGYSYIENIDEEKKKELELIYMLEHDALTNMYNKNWTEKYITNFLALNNNRVLFHAFFIIDIDCFKAINDNFGHAFGDAILSQISNKIAKLFRDEDILGRIGGDEFVVFMKNIQDEKIVLKKAQEICASLIDVLTRNGTSYTISASVGIALYGRHGKTYQDLYKHSDSALYLSKKNGKNQYTMYSTKIKNAQSVVKEIDQDNLMESKIFSNNISEYVFRILFEARDKKAGINSVLELVGKHYDVSRVYIFENSEDGKYTSNTFEWSSTNSVPQMQQLQNISYAKLGDYMSNFNEKGFFHMLHIDNVSPSLQVLLESQNIKTMLQYLITYDGKVRGFVGFDECRHSRIFENKEIADLQNISNILGVFILETRIHEENIASKNITMSIVNALDSYAYVCDPKNHNILFMNNKTKAMLPDAKTGSKCYHALWKNNEPCKLCPMNISDSKGGNTLEMYNPSLNVWVKSTATPIDWIDRKEVCLLNNVDITAYKTGEYPNQFQ